GEGTGFVFTWSLLQIVEG
ncbi:hypothetical protein VCEDC022_003428B, partial [Vibrio cholerae O1 str. EDC-022]